MPEVGKKIAFIIKKLSELKHPDYNPRRISKLAKNKLAQSIKEFGLLSKIVINTHPGRENIIVGGNQTVDVAKELGYEEVQVAEVCLPLEKEKMLNIILNNPNVGGTWDETKLAQTIS